VHIRVDFLYRNWPVRAQGWVDTVLYLFLYFPALLVFTKIAFDYAAVAFASGERGMDTAWLSPPVALSAYCLKGVVPQWQLDDIHRGMLQFMGLQLLALLLILVFPAIALWLPGVIYGP
jgi:TRAP-type mannitol/chloroaromatic compound transport system permease large subunit